MAKNLGETFGEETIAAGLGGLPFMWGETDETITGRENLTSGQNTTLDGVVAAHDSSKKLKNVVETSEFISRFTNQEYLLLERKRYDDTVVKNKVGYAKSWDIVVADDFVDLSKQKCINLKADLVTDGVLTQARADAIFDTPQVQ